MGGSPEDEAAYAMTMGPSARLIDEKKPSDEVRERIRREMVDAFAAYGGEGPMPLPATVFLVCARQSPPRSAISGGAAAPVAKAADRRKRGNAPTSET
jgi:hypothetical protein